VRRTHLRKTRSIPRSVGLGSQAEYEAFGPEILQCPYQPVSCLFSLSGIQLTVSVLCENNYPTSSLDLRSHFIGSTPTVTSPTESFPKKATVPMSLLLPNRTISSLLSVIRACRNISAISVRQSVSLNPNLSKISTSSTSKLDVPVRLVLEQ
jgi:hypothetical protein